jgi:hypothetical protein
VNRRNSPLALVARASLSASGLPNSGANRRIVTTVDCPLLAWCAYLVQRVGAASRTCILRTWRLTRRVFRGSQKRPQPATVSSSDSCRRPDRWYSPADVVLASYGLLVTILLPISVRVFYDPAVQYMLASLSFFRGASFHYIDHHGRPVEILGTVALSLTYPSVSGAREEFIGYHLAHPELFMAMGQGFLTVASVATCGCSSSAPS